MVSDFRKKKLIHVFSSFFDVNHSGSIDKADFDAAVEKAAKIRGWSANDAQFKAAKETLTKIWDALQKRADTDGDGQVSAEEWIQMCDEYATKPAGDADWQALYAKFIFNLQDASSDGSIDVDEFAKVLSAFGIAEAECRSSFQKMSKGKSNVSWEDFQALWKEYFSSDDPSSAGNFIFGKSSF